MAAPSPEDAGGGVMLESMQDPRVPPAVRATDAAQRSKGTTGSVRGFFWGGKVYLVASELHSGAAVAETLLHE